MKLCFRCIYPCVHYLKTIHILNVLNVSKLCSTGLSIQDFLNDRDKAITIRSQAYEDYPEGNVTFMVVRLGNENWNIDFLIIFILLPLVEVQVHDHLLKCRIYYCSYFTYSR